MRWLDIIAPIIRRGELALDGERWHHGSMARTKGTPERSRLVRTALKAFARKRNTTVDEDKDDDAVPSEAAKQDTKPGPDKPDPDSVATQPVMTTSDDLPAIVPPPAKAEPWPEATPAPMKPVEVPMRARTETVGMPTLGDVGKPPDMPTTSAPPPLALGAVENPTHMPGPKDLPGGNPEDPAPPPGLVPPGDSRSLRRGNEFALIYRIGTCVVMRFGAIGTRGQWRVVEYPTYAFASSSYAKECSRFVSEGFSDYRE